MKLLRDTHIDFMKYRKFWIIVSLILVAVGFYELFGPHRLNYGIDFGGGTQVTLRLNRRPDIDRLRSLLKATGMGEAEIQRYGREADNEVIIKTALTKGKGSEEGNRDRIIAALDKEYNQGQAGKLDLNRAGADAIGGLLLQSDPDRVAAQGADVAQKHYEEVAQALLQERRKDSGLFPSWDAVAGVPGVSAAVRSTLQSHAYLGDYAMLGLEQVGPLVGQELRRQGFWAVVLSLLGMLAYIGFRFELRFGVGAVMATLHDVVITLGLFILVGFEFNLITVAAFLTLVGYSTNDTVVIFDRIRENMKKNRRRPLLEVMNESINQTLSRTIMTSGLTMLTVAALLVLGGDVLRGFAFVMTVGIIVGTYSSVYVASPFALLWEQLFGDKGKAARGAAAPAPRGTRAAGEGRAVRAAGEPAAAVSEPKPVTAKPKSPKAKTARSKAG
jgi:preprotein translocase subunit SecF